MSVNLVEMLQGYMSDAVISKVGGLIGESDADTRKASSSIIPSILGGLMKKVDSEDGAKDLFGVVKDSDDGMLDDMLGFLGGDKDDLLRNGASILGSVMGGGSSMTGSIIDLISRAIGFGNSSSRSMMSLLAPVVIGLLKRQVSSRGLGVSGLKDLLLGQKDYVARSAPAGLSGLLGLGGLGAAATGALRGAGSTLSSATSKVADTGRGAVNKTTETVRTSTTHVAEKTKSGGGGFLKWLIPLLLLGLLGYLGFMFLDGCGAVDATKNAANKAVETTKNVGGAVADGAKGAVNKVGDGAKAVGGAVADGAGKVVDGAKGAVETVGDGAKAVGGAVADGAGKVVKGLKNAIALGLPKGSNEAKMADFLASGNKDLSKVFVLDKVFFETGSANLKSESKAQLENVKKILESYPNVSIELRGHTDNKGNKAANKKLSADRAAAVKGFLQRLGITSSRLSSVGFGDEKAIATNGTEEGRKQNRRVDIRVTKR